MVKSTKRKAGTERRPADDEVSAATEAAPSQKKAKKSKKDKKKTNPLPKAVAAAGADECEPPVAAGETKVAADDEVADAKPADTDMDTGFDFDSTFSKHVPPTDPRQPRDCRLSMWAGLCNAAPGSCQGATLQHRSGRFGHWRRTSGYGSPPLPPTHTHTRARAKASPSTTLDFRHPLTRATLVTIP